MASPAQIRAEGVLELGCVEGTSVLFVHTRCGLRIFHEQSMPERQIDAWGARRAIGLLESGYDMKAVAGLFGIGQQTLARDLATAGYVPRDARTLARRARPWKGSAAC